MLWYHQCSYFGDEGIKILAIIIAHGPRPKNYCPDEILDLNTSFNWYLSKLSDIGSYESKAKAKMFNYNPPV